MEKVLGLLVEFAKDNGVGASIPVAIYIVFKVVREDLRSRMEKTSNTSERNHDDIHQLEIKVASLEATVEALKKAVY